MPPIATAGRPPTSDRAATDPATRRLRPYRSADVTAERSSCGGGAVIAVAMGVMNVTTYGYTILAARLLGPRAYGAFAALMGLLLVVSVPRSALQATGARRIAADARPRAPDRAADPAGRPTRPRSVLGAALPGAVARDQRGAAPRQPRRRPRSSRFAAAPLTVMGAQAGILQGERRWIALALIYLGAGVPRLVSARSLIVWRPTEFAALLGVAIGVVRPGASSAGSPCGARATRREHSEEHRGRRAVARDRATTPTRCSRSSRSPTPTSWSPATCSTSTRPACTPAA